MRRAMHYAVLIVTLATTPARSSDQLTLEEWLDLYVSACVGGGSTFTASGSLDAGIGLSLKKLGPQGDVKGTVQISKSEYRLLSEGINNAMSEVAADQADKVRDCLAPFRANLARAMSATTSSPFSGSSQSTVFFLNPFEEQVIRVLATHTGEGGETGKNIPKDVVLRETGLSDIRFRPTMRSLQSMLLAWESKYARIVQTQSGLPTVEFIDVVSLWDKGEEYVLEMGYAK